jgi:type IV pilus assembly protein PilY1
VLGNPTYYTTAQIINYIRGADVLDPDHPEYNRTVITGDVLHSEPQVFQFNFPDHISTTMVFFGANDGMLHAVLDVTDSDVRIADGETNHGTEAWAYIPPDQLHRLKNILESDDHQYYVDSSPKIYFKDVDRDGIIDVADNDQVVLICGERKGGTSYFALDVTDPLAPKYLWRIDRSNSDTGILQLSNINSGLAIGNGGTFEDGDDLRIWDGGADWGPAIAAGANGSFNLVDNILRYDSATLPFAAGQWVGTLTTAIYAVRNTTPIPFIWGQIASVSTADPDVVIPELGESWSEPQFGRVKTSDDPNDIGTPVFFIGGGYSSDNSSGKAVLAINVLTGAVVEKFKNGPNLDGYGNISGMDYSIASSVTLIDADNNGFVDKVYVGDLGGQLWRLGRFTDASNNPLGFPQVDENIHNWTGQVIFSAPTYDDAAAVTHNRQFFYPPSVTLEHGYDLLFAGTGDRDNACDATTSDIFFAVKDNHGTVTFDEDDLVDVTDPADARPDLDSDAGNVDGGNIDQGWYIQLAAGEKVIAENTVFYKTAYITTFTPNDDACLPGGVGKLYALNYKTSAAAIDFDNDGIEDPSIAIGGGIPSKVVMVITDFGGVNNTSSGGAKLFISVGSTNPDANSEAFDAGVVIVDPITPKINFYYLWWRELLTQ